MKPISAIIPAHNEERYLEACLRSLRNYAPGNLLEIIVVDNASSDGTADVAKRFPGVRVVQEPRKGLTQARQRGLKEARGELLAYIDADTRIPAHWFATINEEFFRDPALVALSGPYEYFDLPSWQRRLVRWYWNSLALPASLILGYLIVGGNFVARKDALLEIGGFDTSIPFYGEDTNIARRLRKRGPVRFARKFYVFSSGRRLAHEGMLKTAGTYVANFLSEALCHQPFTRTYKDIR